MLAQPLTEAEIEQLADFLSSDSAPEEAMDVSMMDGFITALASGPNLMMPSSMLRWIWEAEHGEDSPTFANDEESKSIVSLIIRHWNDVNDTLNNGLDEFYEMAKLESIDELFSGRHFDREIIILCVRWYLRFKLSFRDLVEMIGERGIVFSHTTVMRWEHRYAPEFEKRWHRFARPTGQSWRMDETYVKIRGQWVYLYRAVDKQGHTVDFRLSPKRDVAAAKAFFRKALKTQGRAPTSVTLDGAAALHRAMRELPDEEAAWQDTKVRSSKYLNNMIEQDHRNVKARLGPMLGLKDFAYAATTIAGVELMHRIRKGQFHLECLRLRGLTTPAIWNAVLAA